MITLPQEFVVRLKHGITGGFVAPTPKAICQLARSNDKPNSLVIDSSVPQQGTAGLQPLPTRELRISDTSHDSSDTSHDPHSLVKELHSILSEIPMENPPGSEDIYGMDISIFWGSREFTWQNGAPQGCGGGKSVIQATDKQKERFQRAVEIVKELTELEN
ncbi:hypothetical protein FRC11_008533 [Ceratobasidium sp. 423]|nr:hypothetical protein FRC11_008533 [Ceratobasidium sp. 423]